MFDTGQAMRVLEFPYFSLAHLLKHYCNLDVDKKYQLADWRIRPIPEEMQKYAREDTHYLLYIYDMLKNEAIERGNQNQNVLRSIWTRSRDLCLNLFEKEQFTTDGYMELIEKHNVSFSELQKEVFSQLFEWRDRTARIEDESHRYVLPNHMLLQIATVMPTDINSLLACCKPVPPLVKLNATVLINLVQETKDRIFINGPSSFKEQEEYRSFVPYSKSHLDSISHYYSDFAEEKINPMLHTPLRTNGYDPTAPSPVLTTEQLYRTALWTDDPDNETLLPSENAIVSKYNEDFYSHRPLPFSLFTDDEDEDEDEDDELESESGIAAARRTARMVARAWIESPTKASITAFDGESESAPHPLPFDLSSSTENTMQVLNSKNTKKQQQEEDGDDKESEEEDEDEDDEETENKGISLDDIPKSMEEIYQLSNQTRLKKKQKKLKRKISTTNLPTSPLLIKSGEGQRKMDIRVTTHSKKVNDDTPEDPQTSIAFMQSIGWLEGPPVDQMPPPPPQPQSTAIRAPLSSLITEKPKQNADKPPWKRNKMQQQTQNTSNKPGNGGGVVTAVTGPGGPVKTNARGGASTQTETSAGRGVGLIRGRGITSTSAPASAPTTGPAVPGGRRGMSSAVATNIGRGFSKPMRGGITGMGVGRSRGGLSSGGGGPGSGGVAN
eukprot:TRINITY_DN3732_c0_g1_i1.p1 TRINITY_DN3732_c0_g1~~TRINITY_DN3732_c0_g1_i1.p1  ORF type:complete len:774 (-),score=180.19 TRINITY_DN3732_c0_g1_i1:221-2224(-)